MKIELISLLEVVMCNLQTYYDRSIERPLGDGQRERGYASQKGS
jgi:hypothetical protein